MSYLVGDSWARDDVKSRALQSVFCWFGAGLMAQKKTLTVNFEFGTFRRVTHRDYTHVIIYQKPYDYSAWHVLCWATSLSQAMRAVAKFSAQENRWENVSAVDVSTGKWVPTKDDKKKWLMLVGLEPGASID